jgi:hypothetical protein
MMDPIAVFAAAERAFEASNVRPGPDACFRVAGRVLALRFASTALAAKLLPAFAHLEVITGTPADLTICCWDDSSSEVSTPEPTREGHRHGLEYADGPVRIAWEIEERTLQAYDIRRRLALFRAPDVAGLAAWEMGAPFRRILHWWLSGLGLQLVHGAAVGSASGGVLLIGPGGSGKSTMALACVGSSLGYAADDYCILEVGASPRVHSIYSSGKADAAAIMMLPRLAAAFRASPIDQQGKSVLFIAQHAPQSILRSFPLQAIVAPKIVPGSACSAHALPPGEALRALAPSTLFQLPGDRAQSFARMSALIRDMPCWRLHIGDDPSAAQPLLETTIAGKSPQS